MGQWGPAWPPAVNDTSSISETVGSILKGVNGEAEGVGLGVGGMGWGRLGDAWIEDVLGHAVPVFVRLSCQSVGFSSSFRVGLNMRLSHKHGNVHIHPNYIVSQTFILKGLQSHILEKCQ